MGEWIPVVSLICIHTEGNVSFKEPELSLGDYRIDRARDDGSFASGTGISGIFLQDDVTSVALELVTILAVNACARRNHSRHRLTTLAHCPSLNVVSSYPA